MLGKSLVTRKFIVQVREVTWSGSFIYSLVNYVFLKRIFDVIKLEFLIFFLLLLRW